MFKGRRLLIKRRAAEGHSRCDASSLLVERGQSRGHYYTLLSTVLISRGCSSASFYHQFAGQQGLNWSFHCSLSKHLNSCWLDRKFRLSVEPFGTIFLAQIPPPILFETNLLFFYHQLCKSFRKCVKEHQSYKPTGNVHLLLFLDPTLKALKARHQACSEKGSQFWAIFT